MHQYSHYTDPRRRRERKDQRKIFEEIIAENFPNMEKETNKPSPRSRLPGRINPRRNTLRHTVIKLTKIKDRDKILKATWEK